MAVVYRPINRTWYWALKDEGAFKQKSNGEPERLEVSSQADIAGAGILLSRFHLSKDIIKFVDNFSIKKKIPCGSLGLKLCYIAEQIGDITINTSDHPREWDICAGDIILREAGGMLTDMKGNNYVYNKKDTRNWGGMIATNKLLHHRVVEYFNK